jgi:hypothetical protein
VEALPSHDTDLSGLSLIAGEGRFNDYSKGECKMKLQKGFLRCGFDQLICKALLVSLFLLLTNMAAQAQNEANNWFFGNQAGLNFASGTPVWLAGSAMATSEGCAVMSDQNGNLLFYTDGSTVWNKNHQPMPGGTGLKGSSSATQSAIIVPWPGTRCKKYIILTVGAVEDTLPDSLHYSVVDLTLASGLGLGDVDPSMKNVLLMTPVSEKLTAVADFAGTGFWAIAHGFDKTNAANVVNKQYYAYHIDANGINTSPTISTAGSAHTSTPPLAAGLGQMKVSPNRQRIACAVRSRFVEVLNFNNQLGTVSGNLETFDATQPPFQTSFVYGVEFSPDSQLLYVSTTGLSPNQVIQFKLGTTNWTELSNTTGSGNFYDTCALQLGPDKPIKKVYVARANKAYISVINSPDTVGIGCGFTAVGPTLSSSISRLGLPAIIGGDFSCSGINPTGSDCDFAVIPACSGQATMFTDLGLNNTAWLWNFGDGTQSSLQNPTHVYSYTTNVTTYTVTLIVNGGACKVTKVITMPTVPLPPTISGPPTTCQPGTYSVPLQTGVSYAWTVTNGTPTSGSGPSINVTWNPGVNGLVAVTLSDNKSCCKTTVQLFVSACNTQSECCKDVQLIAVQKSLVYQGNGLYTFTPTLTVSGGLGNITKVTATIISASIIYTPTTCGISGATNGYVPNAAANPPTGFLSSLPVSFSKEVDWTASLGVSLAGGVDFPFDIKFLPAPSSVKCSDSLSFCIKYTFTDAKCNTCEIIQCYGPIKRSGGTE